MDRGGEAGNQISLIDEDRFGAAGRDVLNMDLRQNFSQVIAEAVKEIKTRYNSTGEARSD